MLFPLHGKCYFLKEALLRPSPTPSLGLIPVHPPMTQEAPSQFRFHAAFGYCSSPFAALAELCENSGFAYPGLPVVPGR